MGRPSRITALALIVAGLVVLVDVGATLAWQEPVSAAYGWLEQRGADSELDRLRAERLTPAERRALARLDSDTERVAYLARRLRRRAVSGQGIGRIEIDAIGLENTMVQGAGTSALRKGPGHYAGTPLPGSPGTVGVAGHRTTYLAPFRNLDQLKRGHRVVVEMPYARLTYRVEGARVVAPTEFEVLRRVRHDRLVMTTCHPEYSAAQRYVAFAGLIDLEPLGAARL